MEAIEVKLSDIIIQHPEVNSFQQLLDKVQAMTSENMIFLNFDIKPDYRDTPRNWEWKLEVAFGKGGK
ncbi:MAG: hypothetical protein OEU84_07475 [Xanthomonadales bacterium]|nr:hypothetical protein [Xanthomonadales bacterium]MDH4019424.1 hypothetical protein [Xanthomonadales bacterium]